MLNFHSTPTSDHQSIHLSIEPSLELAEKSKIPFNFLHLPYRLIDSDIIADLDGNTVKVLSVITRYVDLREKIFIGKRVLLSGWGIPISYKHIALKCGLSRRTVIRKVKILVEREILQVETVRRCNRYRLTEYAIGIEAVRRAYSEQLEAETERHTPETETFIKPGVPTDEQVKAFIQQEVVTSVTPLLEQIVSHLSPIKELLSKETTLSNTNQQEKKNSLSIYNLKQQHPDWEQYRRYAQAFYGEIPSHRLLVTSCVYFKDLVSHIGFAPDGVDRVLEMIKLVKAAGAYHHTCFDEQFGVKALAKVKEEESRRLRRQAEDYELRGRREADDKSDESLGENHLKEEESETQESQTQSYQPPQSAKEQVSKALYARHCLAQANLRSPYTEEEIKELWQQAYQRFGQPKTKEQWIEDRLDVREQLVKKEILKPYTSEEISQLRRRAEGVEGLC